MSNCRYIKSNYEVRFFHSSFLSEQTGHANSQSSAEIDCRSIEKVASSTVHLEEASSVNMFIIFPTAFQDSSSMVEYHKIQKRSHSISSKLSRQYSAMFISCSIHIPGW
mmetsp:Transcript_31660/g.40663  ORF Transcript_31660/g.40663 Transcript_31660/m.40663 type:complete len:109 (+) Transcript_31660:215-541(+)